MDRNMTIVKIVSQQVNNFPSAGIRQLHIKRNRNRRETVDEIEYFKVVGCNDGFHVFLVSAFNHDLTETQVILNNQYNLIARINIAAIISRFVDELAYNLKVSVFDSFICDPQVSKQ